MLFLLIQKNKNILLKSYLPKNLLNNTLRSASLVGNHF